MNTMTRIALGTVALLASLAMAVPAHAGGPARVPPEPHAPDACTSWFIVVDLGGAPCETTHDAPFVRCDLSRPFYVTRYWFRWYADGAWSQWWGYFNALQPAPRTACQSHN